jgi:hypothetical protein
MTTLLETAFEKASELSDIEQNRFAKLFIEEIQSEKKWDSLFSESEDLLSDMADMALDDYKNNNTTPLTQKQL